MKFEHATVLLEEAVKFLQLKSGYHVIDGTLGGGGHAEKILEATSPDGKLIGIDLDAEAINAAKEKLKKFENRVTFVKGSYADIQKIYHEQQLHIPKVSSILLDLGVSGHQFRDPKRGFTFRVEAPLDMRFSDMEVTTAKEIVNTWPQGEIEAILKEYGEERYAHYISRKITNARKEKPIQTTNELAEIIASAYPNSIKAKLKIHPATKSFQAIRIAVNDELNNLRKFLPQALDILQPGGRLAIISFHSLEDAIVKHYFKQESKDCLCPSEIPICQCGHVARLKLITKKPVSPSSTEQQANPASRSAKLRVIEKI